MGESQLNPFVKEGLDILFVGLNPANGSNSQRHYFSVNQAFWNQLLSAGLITENVNKLCADDEIFGKNKKNYKGWSYGITDLVPKVVDSNSKNVKPSDDDCEHLKELIKNCSPRVVVLLHKKVEKKFLSYVKSKFDDNETGRVGRIIGKCSTMFYLVPFPHGNHIKSEVKIKRYAGIKKYLESIHKK